MKTLVCISIGCEPYFRPRSEDPLCLRDTVVRVQLRHRWFKLSGPYRVSRHSAHGAIRACASKPEDTSAQIQSPTSIVPREGSDFSPPQRHPLALENIRPFNPCNRHFFHLVRARPTHWFKA
jgi:hypothetical protein